MTEKLHGIIPPLVTPLLDRDTLDVAGLERLIEHVLAGGVHGLFVLGTTGEAPNLGYRLRRELIERTCKLVRGRVPVLVGVTDTAFVESVGLAQHSADCGADAVVLAPPYYFPPGQPELLEYFEHIVAALPLPLYLYNMPAMTKLTIEPETVRHVLGLEKIAGLKDSSGDLAYFKELLAVARERPDWSVLVGPEALLAETVALGGDGGVSGGANLDPRLYVDLYEAARTGDFARMSALQQRVLQLGEIYQVGQHASSVIKGLKCALSVVGLCDDFMAEPFHRFRDAEREKVRAIVEGLQLNRH
jgi:4-hydroxy-tetrahydrodipicolinate synthase